MRFVGRDNELSILENEYKKDSSFVVIYGRRRSGKTTLIKEFIKNKKALYFLAAEEVEKANMKRFADSVCEFTGQYYLKKSNIDSWEKIFKVLKEDGSKKKILIIDEFQYLIKSNPGFTSIFQDVLDEVLIPTNTMVIFCGSYISMMFYQIFSYSNPLNGRKSTTIKLDPLSFLEIKSAFCKMKFKDLFNIYTITGGVPKYLECFMNGKSVWDNIEEKVLDRNVFFYDEPIYLLEKEVRELMPFFSVLQAIANGNNEIPQIASVLEESDSAVISYLKMLIELCLVEKRMIVDQNSTSKNKNVLFYIADTYIEFWLKFINPYKSHLEIDNKNYVLNQIKENHVELHARFVFECVCKEYTQRICIQRGLTVKSIHSYGDCSKKIDIMAIDHDKKTVVIGECKYCTSRVTNHFYNRLREKVEDIEMLKQYEKIYIVYVANEFVAKMIELKEDDQLVLTDM